MELMKRMPLNSKTAKKNSKKAVEAEQNEDEEAIEISRAPRNSEGGIGDDDDTSANEAVEDYWDGA